jgi:hypothetical protein
MLTIEPTSLIPGAIQINQFGTAAGETGELRFMEGGASSSQYTGFKAPDGLTTNKTYILPNHDTSAPGSNYVLSYTTGDQLAWQDLAAMGAGDITDVGSVSSGAAFKDYDSTNNQWLGFGESAGRIWFDGDQTNDVISFLDANIGIGTSLPSATSMLTIEPTSLIPGAIQINQFGTAAGETGELRFMEGGASSSQYTGFKAPDGLTTNKTYILPNHDTSAPGSNYVLSYTTGDQLAWQDLASIGGGDITAVGDVTIGAAFVQTNSNTVSSGTTLWFEGATIDEFDIALTTEDPTENITVTIPAIAGTLGSLAGTQTFTGTKTFNDITIADTDISLTGATTALTPTGALTIGATGQNLTLQGAITSITSTGEGNNIVLSPANIVDVQGSVQVTGDITATGSLKLLEGGLTPSYYATIDINDLNSNRTYTIPEIEADGTFAFLEGTQTFTGTKTFNDITIADTNVSLTGATTALTPTGALTIGATSQALTLQGSDISLSVTSGGFTNTLSFAAPTDPNKSIIIPNASGTIAVSASAPIELDEFGNIDCPDCLTTSGTNAGVLFHPASAQVDDTTNPSIFISKTGIGNLLNLTQASVLSGNYSSNDISLTRNLTGSTYTQGGSYISISDASSGTGTINPTGLLMSINTPVGSSLYSGNFIDLRSSDVAGGIAASKFVVDASGKITSKGGIAFSGAIATEITNDTGDLDITSGGGNIFLNDSVKLPALTGNTATSVVCQNETTGLLEGCAENANDVTLQLAYDADTDSATAEILMTAEDGSIVFKNISGAVDTQFQIAMASNNKPEIDMMNITNAGVNQGVITNAADALQIDYVLGAVNSSIDVAGLRLNLTSVAPNSGNPTFQAIDISNLVSAQAAVTETAIRIGTGWDTGISIGSGGIAVNGGDITSTQSTLIINAGGTIDIQDILNADSITTDTGGVTIAAGQSYTGSGAVTLSSGGTAGLTLDSASGTITIATDDDILPTLGAGDATIGSAALRWDYGYFSNLNTTSLTVNGVTDPYVHKTGDTMTGALTFSGVETDITTADGEDLTLSGAGAGTIRLNDDTAITGTLTLSGAAVDITTGTNESLTLSPHGTGDIIFSLDNDTNFQLAAALTGTTSQDLLALTLTNQTTSGTQRGIVLTNADDAANATTESLIFLDNAETTASTLLDAILITSSGVSGGIIDAVDVSDANILNAINVGANFILFDGIRAFGSATGTFTIEDTDGNDLLTLTDNGTTGNLSVTGTATVETLASASGTYLCIDENNTLSACSVPGGSSGFVQLQPTTAQSASSLTSLIWLNETNAGASPNLIELEVDGADRFVIGNTGLVTLRGGLAADITTQGNSNLTLDAGGTGMLQLADTTIRLTGGSTTLQTNTASTTTLTISNLDASNVANLEVEGSGSFGYLGSSLSSGTSLATSGNVGIGTTSPDGRLVVMGGNVGIGVSSPQHTLDVHGDARIGTLTGMIKGTDGVLSAATAGTDYENPLTFSNGLTRTDNNVTLGGVLTGITTIDTAGFTFGFEGTGNVGIGTTTPGARLQVDGAGVFGYGKTAVAGPSNGLAVLGNLGLGTTSPFQKLHVEGSGYFSGNIGIGVSNPGARLAVAGGGLFGYSEDSIVAPVNGLAVSGNVGIGTTSPLQALHLQGSGYVSGNLGIGKTSPVVALDIEGDVRISSLDDDGWFVKTSPTGQLTSAQYIDLGTEVSGILPVVNGGTGLNAGTAPEGSLLIGNGSGFTIATLTAGTGIGVSNNEGSIVLSNLHTASNGLTLASDVFKLGGTLTEETTINLGVFNLGFQGAGNVGIGTTSPDGRLVVMGGNVGIGVSSPQHTLDVHGDARIGTLTE